MANKLRIVVATVAFGMGLVRLAVANLLVFGVALIWLVCIV